MDANMNLVPDMLTHNRLINSIAKQYSALSYYVQLSSMLEQLYPARSFENTSKYNLHKILNQTFIKYYKGEEILKYLLAKRYLGNREIVGAYEMNVNKSRVDFLVINGRTTSFEIKSSLDNLTKLHKQIEDYQSVFDYNHLVVDEVHFEKAKKILPADWGLWVYRNGAFYFFRKASRNAYTNVRAQLMLMSKIEIAKFIQKDIPPTDEILERYSQQEIASAFRMALKSRYRNRWEFVTSHKRQIMPVDYQFFFNNNLNPKKIYDS
jgi:hypothetical protein